MSYCPSQDWDRYHDEQEKGAINDMIRELSAAIRERNDGRNLAWYDEQGRKIGGCFGLCSFGWKDADLDPAGCTGIDEIIGCNEDTVTVLVSGHKTFCDPTHECEWDLSDSDKDGYRDAAHGIVCDAVGNGEWTGDDWSWSFREELTVPWAADGDFQATADAIIEAARRAAEPYSESWSEVDAALDSLYQAIRAKYEQPH